MIKKIQSFFKGNKRTVKAKKNIAASLVIKGSSIIVGFLMVRIVLSYLDPTRYGIWLTITSFITWFSFFEIGLGSGLKNKLSEALAIKDYELGKIYVSTTYAILTLVISVVAVVFFIANFFIDWSIILATEKELANQLTILTFIVFGFFFLTFIIKLIGIVLEADQRPAIANAFSPIGNLIALVLIYILTKTTEGSLIYLAWVISVVPVVVLIIATIYFYNTDYKKIAPSLSHVKFEYAKNLLSLGIKFFLIQVSALVMFQSSNIIISQFYGPAEVTPYQLAYKLFGVITMLFGIIIAPFWAAFNEAWTIKDITWIKNTINKLLYIWLGLVVISIILFFISDTFFDIWITKKDMASITITSKLKIYLIIYFLLFTFGGIFNMFINGAGKVSVQMYSLLIGAILFFPISLFFIKVLNMGIESVVLATLISNFYSPLIAPYQYYLIIKNKAHGIWNK